MPRQACQICGSLLLVPSPVALPVHCPQCADDFPSLFDAKANTKTKRASNPKPPKPPESHSAPEKE